MQKTYHTIKNISKGEFEDKKSKFLAYAIPIKSLQEFKQNYKKLKEKHPKAKHLPYAFKTNLNSEEIGFSDDGEPTGSAGKPIFYEIERLKLKNTAIIVARYFGGTKLGVGGLVRAFSTASANSLENATIIKKPTSKKIQITTTYNKLKQIETLIHQNKLETLSKNFNETCKYELLIPTNSYEKTIKEIKLQQINYKEYEEIY